MNNQITLQRAAQKQKESEENNGAKWVKPVILLLIVNETLNVKGGMKNIWLCRTTRWAF
jgi:hypothetical protein